jgi:actin-related protein
MQLCWRRYGAAKAELLLRTPGPPRNSSTHKPKTDITPIVDCKIVRHAAISIPVGGREVDAQLLRLLEARPLPPPPAPYASWRAAAAADPLLLARCKEAITPAGTTLGGHAVAAERLAERCLQPLFEPALAGVRSIGVHEALALAISRAGETERQAALWESCVLTGGLANMPGMRDALEARLAPLLAASETAHEHQPKEAGWKGLPDVFADYAGRPGDVSFVGACVVARIAFPGSSHLTFVSKEEYEQLGPAAVHLLPGAPLGASLAGGGQ